MQKEKKKTQGDPQSVLYFMGITQTHTIKNGKYIYLRKKMTKDEICKRNKNHQEWLLRKDIYYKP